MAKKKKKDKSFKIRPSTESAEVIESRYEYLDAYADQKRTLPGIPVSHRIERTKIAYVRLQQAYANDGKKKSQRKSIHYLFKMTRMDAGWAFCAEGFFEEKPITSEIWEAVDCSYCRDKRRETEREKARALRREAKRMAKQREEREARLALEREKQRKKDRRKARKKLRKRKSRAS